MNADNTNILERSCIGCKRAISVQWTMYECECCRVTVCPECICAARLITSRLNKIDLVSKSLGSTVIAQSVAPKNVAQLAKNADARVPTGSTANRVKRKPIPGTVTSTASTGSQLESWIGTNTGLAQNTSSSLPMPYPVQNAPSTSMYQNPQHVYHPVSDQSQVRQPGSAPISQTSYLPERPVMLPHAWTEPITRQIPQNRTASASQPSQQRPHLQHVRTAPMGAAGVSHNHRELSTNPIPGKSRPMFSKGNRRASLVATAKKVSHNKWVQAGAKMGAKLALGAVIGDATSDLVVNSGFSAASGLGSLWNSNGSSNSVSNTNDVAPSLFGDIGSNNNDDLSSSNDVATGLWNNNGSTLDVSNTNYTAPGFGSTNDLSSTNYIAPGFASNNGSFNDLSNTAGYDTTSQPDFSAPNYAQQESTFDTISLEQDTSGTPIPDTSSINGYDASYTDPSQGGLGYEPDYAQDQLDSAQDGLSNAVYNEDVAVDDGASDAISASNAYVDDSINNANYALAYGPDAIPGESATPDYEDDDSDGV